MALGTSLAINTLMTLLVIPLMPTMAAVGDRWLRRPTWVAIFALALVGWPTHEWMLASGGSIASVVAVHALTFTLLSVPLRTAPAPFVEMFAQRDQLSDYSVAFYISVGIFGSLTPIIATAPRL